MCLRNVHPCGGVPRHPGFLIHQDGDVDLLPPALPRLPPSGPSLEARWCSSSNMRCHTAAIRFFSVLFEWPSYDPVPYVLQFFDLPDLRACSLVCTAWSEMVAAALVVYAEKALVALSRVELTLGTASVEAAAQVIQV